MIDLIKIRRDLHKIPELGFKEFNTQKYILNILKNYRCKIYQIKTGILAFFDNNQKTTLVYRCEMDALNIKEENDVLYKSSNSNMHACAHDGHMAIALGLCTYLNTNSQFKENIGILFQPSEESYGGSLEIINSNILDHINTSKIIGIHFFPKLNENIFYSSKVIFSSAREINIKLISQNIHVANKKNLPDPILISSKLINKLCSLSNKSHLIHFGIITAGETRNSLASSCSIQGTIRSKKDDLKLVKRIIKIINKHKKRYHINIQYDTSKYLPMIKNDNKLLKQAKKLIDLNVINKTFLQGEDFSLYGKKYPILYLLYGIGETNYLHTPNFNFDEALLTSCFNKVINLLNLD